MTTTLQVRLARRPVGMPDDDTYDFVEEELPALEDGRLLLRVVHLSLDPYMRGRMSDAPSYAAPVPVGGLMVGGTVCQVEESRHPDWQVGDWALSYSGWQTQAISDGSDLRRLDPSVAPPSTALGVLGMPGFTAYAGLLEIGRPKEGETVVVAAATGPVGSAVGQIARLKGARAVGIAGGPEKCAALLEEFGFDVAVDHRSPTFADDLAAAVPDGIDVYFENVGGPVQRQVFRHLNTYARVPVCGLVADYNATSAPEGPDRLPGFMGQVLRKSLTVRGFIQDEFTRSHGRDFVRDMGGWVADGSVRYREDVVEGLRNAPEAFRGLLSGKNFGKLVVRVSDPV
ncbi:NADP-dependent oxidoreductase [Nocardioides marmoribigeumensis]|uniref:NADPH-dependent curcumin reductase CurA n=1 Tax=Nocardioides marmoribigeumensis TaxID=433649 RepID=A0ABU2BQB9_9ACTN|nr:NADP-dependent oxidoreductase [Nocardioides marmoribigeumensis]MDR7360822.1 NADPH-dependent curcumin reductase CurA [Nocardioides marmoribigeumensis]